MTHFIDNLNHNKWHLAFAVLFTAGLGGAADAAPRRNDTSPGGYRQLPAPRTVPQAEVDAVVTVVLNADRQGSQQVPAPYSLLFADWGEGSRYDLNCDGIVDNADWWLFWETQDELPADMTYWGLIGDYGSGSVWDLDCDGTVGMRDFMMLNELEYRAALPAQQLAINGLFADWGLGSRYDLNCDGRVDNQDFWLFFELQSEDRLADDLDFFGLIGAYGSTTDWDLDCDGVVGILDMFLLFDDIAQGSIG